MNDKDYIRGGSTGHVKVLNKEIRRQGERVIANLIMIVP